MKKLILFTTCLFSFSMMLMAQTEIPVPVRITSFDAKPGHHFNQLFWKTACALDYAGFEIQRSYNGSAYTAIHSFKADRFRCLQPFDFSDSNANKLAGRIFYRLKVADLDGRVYHSKIVSVITRGAGMEINSFTPTLVTGSAALSISSPVMEDAFIAIINIQGKIVQSQKISIIRGVNNIQVNTNLLQPGKYWLRLTNRNNAVRTVQFLKQ